MADDCFTLAVPATRPASTSTCLKVSDALHRMGCPSSCEAGKKVLAELEKLESHFMLSSNMSSVRLI